MEEVEKGPQQIRIITTEDMAPVFKTKYSQRQNIFTLQQEEHIAEYCIERSQMNYGLTYPLARELAYKYAVALNIDERILPPKWHGTGLAGEDWLYHFMKRHPYLSLRQAENTSLSRNTG